MSGSAITGQDAFALFAQAQTAKTAGQAAEALRLCEAAIVARPQYAAAHMLRGELLLGQQRFLESATAYHTAWLFTRFRPEPLLMCARALTSAKFFLEACALFERVSLDALDEVSAIFYAEALRAEMRAREGLRVAERFAQSRLVTALEVRGGLLLDMGRVEEARALLEAARPQAEREFVFDRLIGVYFAQGDIAALRALLAEAERRFPQVDYYRAVQGVLDVMIDGREPRPGAWQGNARADLVDAARYLKAQAPAGLRLSGATYQTYDLVAPLVPAKGAILEFGVRFGHTITYLAELFPRRRLHGFDSFEGIPEAWGEEEAGSYSTHGRLPAVPKHVELIAGWYEDTLPGFAARLREPIALLHVDCDLYSSTKTVFEHLGRWLAPGSIVLFDEYIGNTTWRDDEFKAFQEWVSAQAVGYEYLVASFFTKQVAVRIVRVGDDSLAAGDASAPSSALQRVRPDAPVRRKGVGKSRKGRAKAGKRGHPDSAKPSGAGADSPPDETQRVALHEQLNALYQGERYGEAEQVAAQATQRWAEDRFVWLVLGTCQVQQGRAAEGVAALERAQALDPQDASAPNNLGNALQDLGRYEEAVACYQRAVALEPSFLQAYNNLGNALQKLKRYAEAVPHYERVLKEWPDNVEVLSNLSCALRETGRLQDAELRARAALAQQPAYVEALNNLGLVLMDAGRYEEALASFQTALTHKPNFVEALRNLGVAHITMGDKDAAFAAYARALESAPQDPKLLSQLASVHVFSGEDDPYYQQVKALEPQLDHLPAEGRIALLETLAQAREQLGADAEGFAYLVRANQAMRAQQPSGIEWIENSLRRTAETFSRERLAALHAQALGLDAERPVFIVGMPRSGTTLAEQVLASHPLVHGAGELGALEEAMARGVMIGETMVVTKHSTLTREEALGTADGLQEIARRYLAAIERIAPDTARRVTDKMPSNMAHLGLIRLALPRATIIHCQRHPLDNCLSCFTTHFEKGHEWSYDLVELGRYYNAYWRLMAHWREALPGGLVELRYEDLVADFPTQARRLVAACGLAWDAACERFWETRRPVKTASVTQVRQPLYRTSVGKWRRYEQQLRPLLETLEPAILREWELSI